MVVNRLSNDVSILLGRGDGSFGPATSVAVGSGPFSGIVSDLNADHKLDFVVGNIDDHTLSVRLHD